MKATLIIILIIAFGVACILLVKGGNRFDYYGDNREEEIWDDIIERNSR